MTSTISVSVDEHLRVSIRASKITVRMCLWDGDRGTEAEGGRCRRWGFCTTSPGEEEGYVVYVYGRLSRGMDRGACVASQKG